ncbi:hypothetical protein FDP41_003539 [Naegleria fowleri]|uniref:Uncharacterized protein n=1 Tax=Naegleria fowleri TaxID=5763 RepID=A0A6A5BKM3_NAEFO|nr:uncharacterized protein FDP41_003539 [Naegleria fowleri]KAF0977547.1 hypothetical protein FDP41_003539 [Naegleria fowleri]
MSKYSLQPPSSSSAYTSVPHYEFQQQPSIMSSSSIDNPPHTIPPPYPEGFPPTQTHQQQTAVIYTNHGVFVPEQQPYIPSQYEVNGVLNPVSHTIIQYTTGNNVNQGQKAHDWNENPNSCCIIL